MKTYSLKTLLTASVRTRGNLLSLSPQVSTEAVTVTVIVTVAVITRS